MTITLGWWAIPTAVTAVAAVAVFRPYTPSGHMFDLGPIERVLWAVPVALVWLVYFMIVAIYHGGLP